MRDIFGALQLMVGCAVSSLTKKLGKCQSEYSGDPAKTVRPSKANLDVYRVYNQAATRFVPIGAVREGQEDRGNPFCLDQGQVQRMLASEQSNPPYPRQLPSHGVDSYLHGNPSSGIPRPDRQACRL